MAGSDQLDFSGFIEMLGGELADRLQHPVARPRLAAPILDDNQRTVGQRRQQLEAGARAYCQCSLDLEAAGEDRELAHQRAFGI